MLKTFDMQFIRYINLFGRITRVQAKHCFPYNNMLVFVVPRMYVQSAIGPNNVNLRKLSDILAKRIRVVSEPHGRKDIAGFVSVIVSPAKFEKLEVIEREAREGVTTEEKELVITTSGRENKAMLIGRGRARERELKDIIEQYFGIKNVRIL